MRIGIDIGGVISKYPDLFRALIAELSKTNIEIFVISDMHDHKKMVDMLKMNEIPVDPERVISANYKDHGELCKAIVCEKLGIDILIDDFIGYVAAGKHLRCLVMPNPTEPYFHDSWKTDGSEGDFGRRTVAQRKTTKFFDTASEDDNEKTETSDGGRTSQKCSPPDEEK